MKLSEKQIHKQITDFIKLQYPKVIFNTDSSGLKLTIGQATQMKKLRSSNGFPDITIYEPTKKYSGLFLEVKKETPFKKDGYLKKDKHLQEQREMHIKLSERGYFVKFVWTLDQAKTILSDYFRT
jgi:hypothetical protein